MNDKVKKILGNESEAMATNIPKMETIWVERE